MKKLNYLVICLLILSMFSCNNEDNKINSLIDSMLLIEKALKSGDFEICNEISPSSKNELFFKEFRGVISEFYSANISSDQEETVLKNANSGEEFEFNVEDYPFLAEAIKDYPYKEEYIFSQVENIIFQSYTNSLQNMIESPIFVTQYYIEQIEMLDIELITKSQIIYALEFWQDLFIFIDEEIFTKGLTGDWPYELCVERCQRDIYNSYNWIQWAQCLLNPGACTLWNLAICMWDCLPNNQNSGSSSGSGSSNSN